MRLIRPRRCLAAMTLLIAIVATADEQVSTSIDIGIAGFSVSSHGTVYYYSTPIIGGDYVTGKHYINDGGAGTVVVETFGPYEKGSQNIYLTKYDRTVSGATIYEHCYRAGIEATGQYGTGQAQQSGMKCAPPAPPGPETIDNTCSGTECAPSPIVINFERRGYQLSGTNAPVFFDIAASGVPMRICWTAAQADEAFLWLDRNHNGVVDSGAELFGNATPLMNGSRAANGFEPLRELDSNGDGAIDQRDAVWPRLSLWRDTNHDGVSQPSEIGPVAASGLAAINLDYHWTGRRDASGNLYRYQSRVWIAFDSAPAVPRPVYDIFFAPAP